MVEAVVEVEEEGEVEGVRPPLHLLLLLPLLFHLLLLLQPLLLHLLLLLQPLLLLLLHVFLYLGGDLLQHGKMSKLQLPTLQVMEQDLVCFPV